MSGVVAVRTTSIPLIKLRQLCPNFGEAQSCAMKHVGADNDSNRSCTTATLPNCLLLRPALAYIQGFSWQARISSPQLARHKMVHVDRAQR